MRERKPCRSDKYQVIYNESSFPSEMLESFSIDDGMPKRLNYFPHNEEIMDLEEQLRILTWKLVENHLPPRQLEILQMTKDGYTQMEIARYFGINQSSITKSLYNDPVANNKNSKKPLKTNPNNIGAIAHIKQLVEQDEEIQKILKRIKEIRDIE